RLARRLLHTGERGIPDVAAADWNRRRRRRRHVNAKNAQLAEGEGVAQMKSSGPQRLDPAAACMRLDARDLPLGQVAVAIGAVFPEESASGPLVDRVDEGD